MHILTFSILAAVVTGTASLPRPTNVPELMRTFAGEQVKSPETWEKVRKPEIRQRFLERMYGVRPVAAEKPDVSFAPAEPDREMLDGQAVRKRVKISYRGPYGENAFVATAFIPKSDRPVPAFVLICNRDPKENLDPDRKVKSDFWPVEQIVARGYAAIAFFNGDVAPETYNPATAFLSGVFACYERPQDRTDRSWGTLSAWAWGASRVLDWIETEPLLDAKRVAVVGHSRGGKTSLLAGATDERWAMTCVNDSGCGGAKLANVDLPASEYYAIFLGSRVTYWFCGAFQKHCMNHDRRIERIDAWKDRWPFVCEPLSVDQHQWAAMVAPRLLAIGSATEDHGAGPLGEFYTALLSSPAWELYGRRGLAGDEFPPPMAPVAGGDVSYHLRAGKHDLTAYDWSVYMDFADRHGWRQVRPAGRRGVLPAASSASAVDLIDPMIGTDGTGHAFPGPARPFGLVQPSPDTGNGDWDHCSGYAARDRSILRFSQTHLNGTGQTSLGDVGILPFVGTAPLTAKGLCASFSKTNEWASPGCYRVKLDDGARVEIAAGRRVARYRLTFPNDRPSGVLLDFGWGLYRQADYLPLLTTTSRVERVSDCCLRGENTSEVFAPRTIGFALRFDRRPDRLRELPRNEGDRAACFVAEYGQGGTVELVVAVSSRSARGAECNLAAEGDVPFDRLVAETRSEWKVLLDRLDLTGLSEDECVSAATALYHLCLQPNDISDAGEPPRYSTFSLWDTFRDAHPLYERLVPERVLGFVTSLLSHYDAWGYLPQWELWGRETGCMIGSHAVPVVVDACLHGFLKGPDVEKAYRAVRDTLTKEERPGKGALYPQRTDWKVYDAYGYYPFDLIPRESVSRTLECCVDDFKAAQLARSLGHDEDAAFFERRSWNFTNLFDRATLCFRGKDTKGRWREPFEPARAGQADFTEGSPLQYSWYVPCRPDWLVAAMGGPTAFERRLDAFFAGTLFPGAERCYNRDITGLIGDYAHGNEPCQHVPNLYRLVGRDDKAEALVARIGREFYRNAPDGLSGNDDCGQMSAWYLRHVILKRQSALAAMAVTSEYAALREELRAFYPDECHSPCKLAAQTNSVQAIAKDIDAYVAAHPAADALDIRRASYLAMRRHFVAVLFRNLPFYFEAGVNGGWSIWSGDKAVPSRHVNAVCRRFYKEKGLIPEAALRLLSDRIGSGRLIVCCGPFVDDEHHVPPFHAIFTKGFKGVRDEVAAALAKCPADDPLGRKELETALVGLDTIREIQLKFAEAAKEKLKSEVEVEGRKRLVRIVDSAQRCPWEPPQNFFEGLNTLWFVREILGYVDGVCNFSLGRPDAWLIDFYRADLAAGRLTKDEARRLVEQFLIASDCHLDDRLFLDRPSDQEAEMPVTLGGCDSEGRPVWNELTEMFLDAHLKQDLVFPKLHCRISKDAPQAYLEKIGDLLMRDHAVFALFNDDRHIPNFQELGVPLERARDYVGTGCWDGNVDTHTDVDGANYVSVARILEMTIHRNPEEERRYQVKIDPIDGATSYEAVEETVYRNFIRFFREVLGEYTRYGRANAKVFPHPTYSMCLDGCVESRRDTTDGGTAFRPRVVTLAFMANVVDSLCAIRKVCFEDRAATLDEFLTAVRSNWAGETGRRLRGLAMAAPYWGDNTAASTSLMRRWIDRTYADIEGLRNDQGGPYVLACWIYREFVNWGAKMKATPDGRHDGDRLAQGFAPSEFRCKEAASAVIGALGKLDHSKLYASNANLMFEKEGMDPEVFAAIFRVACESGMHLLQPNCASVADLLDAQVHPERHQNIIVKVCGFSARFVHLSKRWQDEIIARHRLR